MISALELHDLVRLARRRQCDVQRNRTWEPLPEDFLWTHPLEDILGVSEVVAVRKAAVHADEIDILPDMDDLVGIGMAEAVREGLSLAGLGRLV